MKTDAIGTWALWGLTGYLVLSMVTLPFLDALWLGELPLLALIQLPKIRPAVLLEAELVIPTIQAMGLSTGSISRDHAIAKPYALLLVYLVPALALAIYAFVSKQGRATPRAIALLAAAFVLLCIDYAFTLYFATGPGFSMY